MHNKIYALIITFLVSISFCCSAYATAIEGDGLNEIVNEVNTEGSEVLNSEGSEGSSDVGSDISSEVPENLIVDISEESISAIADAVNTEVEYQYAYQYSIPIGDSYITLDTNIENLFDNYKVILLGLNTSTTNLIICDEANFSGSQTGNTKYMRFTGSVHRSLGSTYANFISGKLTSYLSFDTVADFGSNIGGSYTFNTVHWSNFHVFDTGGNLIYKSPYPPPAVVTFNTGFEDLVVDSQLYDEGFVLPNLKYHGDYIFEGWFYDADFSSEYIVGTDIWFDTTLYAKWREAPEWDFVATDFFDSLIEFFTCEPIFYIFSLICFVIILACIRVIISSRL